MYVRRDSIRFERRYFAAMITCTSLDNLIFLAVLHLRDNISASDILCVSLSNYNGYLIR